MLQVIFNLPSKMEVYLLLILFMVSVYILWNCDISMPLKILILMLGIAIYFTVFPASETFLAITVPDVGSPFPAFGASDPRRAAPLLFSKLNDQDIQSTGVVRSQIFNCTPDIGTRDREEVAVKVGLQYASPTATFMQV